MKNYFVLHVLFMTTFDSNTCIINDIFNDKLCCGSDPIKDIVYSCDYNTMYYKTSMCQLL